MARKPNPVPKYEKHPTRGTARVRWVDSHGVRREASLGKYGSPASKAAYRKLLAAIQAERGEGKVPALPRPLSVPETVMKLARLFVERVLPTKSAVEGRHFTDSIAVLVEKHADTDPAEFGPKALNEVRDSMSARGWTRQTITGRLRRVKAVFRWAESVELVPAGKWHQLCSLPGLKRGGGQREDRVIKPVGDDIVEATLPHLYPTVAAMVRFHRLTGCRPQDVCNLHCDDLDRSLEDVWVARPDKHKNRNRGLTREIYIGPKAQQVILPYLTGGFVFCPRRAWQERSDARRKNARRLKHNWTDRGPPLNIREQFDETSYRRAVKRACKRAGVPAWAPNQLRHLVGTEIRQKLGLEAAQKLLGHKHSKTTERYAAPLDQAAIDAARKYG